MRAGLTEQVLIGHAVLHYARVLARLDQPQTQTTRAERELLVSFLPGAKRVVEIGVFEGFTTRILAERADADAIVYGVDPFFAGRLGICWGERIARSYNRRHLASGKVRFIAKFSTEVGSEVRTPVDFVFIDGDHSLPGISADWAYWSERVAPGGVIALHDTLLTPDKPEGYTLGTIAYFHDYIRHDPRFDIVGQQDSLSVLRKR
jgi:predicted O-methyltransferase YrrM